MTSELFTFTEMERNALYFFDPYDDGVSVDLDTLDMDFREALTAMTEKGFFVQTLADNDQTHIKLTEQGLKVTRPWDFE